MKLIFIMMFMSPFVFAKKTVIDFNQVLNEEIQSDIKKDEDRFKATPVERKPASVEPEEAALIKEHPKLDKNVRQIGPKYW